MKVSKIAASSMFTNGHFDQVLKFKFTNIPYSKAMGFAEILRDKRSEGVNFTQTKTKYSGEALMNFDVNIRAHSWLVANHLISRAKAQIEARYPNFFLEYRETSV